MQVRRKSTSAHTSWGLAFDSDHPLFTPLSSSQTLSRSLKCTDEDHSQVTEPCYKPDGQTNTNGCKSPQFSMLMPLRTVKDDDDET